MKYKRSVYRTFALITQLGLSMITPIFLLRFSLRCFGKKFSISLFIPLVIMGVLAGGRNTYYLAKHANEDPEEKEEHKDE